MPQSSDLLEDVYLQNIKFYEGWTESLFQIMLNAAAMSDLGIESPIQYFSFTLSFATLTKCIADRISYLKHNRDLKLFSIRYLIDLLEGIIMFQLCFLGYVFQTLTNDEKIPSWMALPLISILLYLSNVLLHHCFAVYWILVFGLQYLFNFVSFVR